MPSNIVIKLKGKYIRYGNKKKKEDSSIIKVTGNFMISFKFQVYLRNADSNESCEVLLNHF